MKRKVKLTGNMQLLRLSILIMLIPSLRFI